MVPPNPQIISTHYWNDSGLNLPMTKRGKILSITIDATTSWTANINPGGGGMYDARGWLGHPAHYHVGYKCPGLNEGCLVARIAKEGVMLIFCFDSPNVTIGGGKIHLDIDVPADVSGNLEMGINDVFNGMGDNTGILNILDVTWKERLR